MNVLIWNTRGAAKKDFRSTLKSMVRKNSADIVVLLETKTQSEVCKKLMKKLGFDSLLVQEAQGFAGGIWLMWHSSKVDIALLSKSVQFIHCRVSLPTGNSFDFTAIYASPSQNVRNNIWEDLRKLSETMNRPWLLGGDFNEIAYTNEKIGGVPADPTKCANFSSVLEDCQVIDLGYDGPLFTWQGPKWTILRRIFKRLDRVVVNLEWRMMFDDARVSSLPRILSDHNPLLIKLFENLDEKGKKPFRFFVAWQEHQAFNSFIRAKWDSDFDFPYMLQRLVPELRIWNKKVFGDIDRKKNSIIQKIANIQNNRTQNDSQALLNLENDYQRMLINVLREEELFWFQESRKKWIADGDRNTRFYHLSTVVRRNSNKIFKLKNDGEAWISDPEELKNMACNFFKTLFTEDLCDKRWISSGNLWHDLLERERIL
ncbi:uncharacterized protein LOC133306487 [Gastrolobium bilobum]|uniref:uncharacterized protein LOC133306487 n=1 Tax=Gastrolobium bilobum TaxID=150636 RepID=UPI002AB22B94|nr:uncharacterized protein LOC133306487 [Gastrolobium bilobum]